MHLEGSECAKESIEFELGLGKAALPLIKSDRTESRKVSLLWLVWVGLREVETHCYRRGVDCDNDWGAGVIINASKGWRVQQRRLEIFLHSNLRWTELEWSVLLRQDSERVRTLSKVLDEHVRYPYCAKESSHFSETRTRSPSYNLGYSIFVWQATLRSATVSDDSELLDT